MPKQLILASSSPRRRELLAGLGIPFDVMASDTDESYSDELTPQEIVEELSLRKARAVAAQAGEGVIIGSDTIVVLDGRVLGKPVDAADAFTMLHSLQGREHTVFTGVALLDIATGKTEVSSSATRVEMRAMSDEEIHAYIATGEPMDKAGSYAIQGIGATLVTGIAGDYFTVVGLPLALTAGMLARFGIEVLKRRT